MGILRGSNYKSGKQASYRMSPHSVISFNHKYMMFTIPQWQLKWRGCCCCVQRRTTMLMYKNVICFFSFITQNVWMGRVGESQSLLKWTHRSEIWIFREPLLHSAFARLVQGHFKALNHLNFSLLLYFCESGIGPFQGIELS